jgi:hypothetical protein
MSIGSIMTQSRRAEAMMPLLEVVLKASKASGTALPYHQAIFAPGGISARFEEVVHPHYIQSRRVS